MRRLTAVCEAPRGVLQLQAGRGRFEVSRFHPGPDLAELVEHYWMVSWDLRGRAPHTQHTLPHPGVHLVAEPDRSGIQGVLTGRFIRRLEGRGRAFGIRFRPAGFHPYLGRPVSALTDRRVAVAEAFLAERRPGPDPNVALVNRVVDEVMADRALTLVKDLSGRFRIGPRRLQRLFATYTGVPPKWVIRRARLHEAVERLDQGDDVDLALLARDLGYFDQAHFAHDFRAAVGHPPAAYARSARDHGFA